MVGAFLFLMLAILVATGALAQGDADAVDSKVQMGLSLFEMMAPVVTALLGWLALHVNGWIKTRTKNEMLSGLMARANDLIWTLVKEANQVLVADIKAAHHPDSPGGAEILKAELDLIKKNVVKSFKRMWGPYGLVELGKVLGLAAGLRRLCMT